MELYVQRKDYKNAHQTQIDIANLTKKEKEKFEREKFKTIQKEIENLQKRQLNETKGLEQKIQSIYNDFKKNRALKVQELLLKYKKLKPINRTFSYWKFYILPFCRNIEKMYMFLLSG